MSVFSDFFLFVVLIPILLHALYGLKRQLISKLEEICDNDRGNWKNESGSRKQKKDFMDPGPGGRWGRGVSAILPANKDAKSLS